MINFTKGLIEIIKWFLLTSMGLFLLMGISLWQGRDTYNAEPRDVLNHVVDRLNDWNNDKIIRTQLDQVNNDEWVYGDEFALANTLDSTRVRITIYLQWLSFMAMVVATVLIIYNGLRLVLSPMQPEEAANIKKRLLYILLWLLVSTWFYFIIKITLSVAIQATY